MTKSGTTATGERSLSVIYWGGFSGTVRMLQDPLELHARVEYHDITDLTRHPRLLPARLAAHAVSLGRHHPWHKTGIWSKALQRHMVRAGWVSSARPTVFYQTLAAPDLDGQTSYVVYTDRVGREGALEHEAFRSTWGPGWEEREEQFLKRARSVLVMGPSTKRALAGLYGVEESVVRVVGAGPGSEVGPIQTVSRQPRRILFVGTNWRLKGGPEILAAFESISKRHSDLELLLVGSEPDRSLPPGARSLGRVAATEMPTLFKESDLFVVPTYMEALGYSLLEAVMHGLPAIGSTVGNQGWVIGDAGLTVPPGDVARIVDAIESVLADYPSFQERATQRAKELRNKMSWDSVATAITDAAFGPIRATDDLDL